MIALDTNVVVRFLVDDDKSQAHKARELIATNRVLLLPTVLLETEWVLRSSYGYSAGEILGFLQMLLGLETGLVSEPEVIIQALEDYEAGMDFADAMHLAYSTVEGAETFASFDRPLAARAEKRGRQVLRP